MMKMMSTKPMKTAKIGYIVISVLLCVLGAVLVIFPGISVKVLGIITGLLMIVFGAVKLIGYFSKDLYRLAFQFDLAFGILMIILGIVVLVKPDRAAGFICIVLGISVLADGLFKIQIALDAKSFGLRLWWLIFAFAVVTGIVGAVLIIRPGAGSRFIMTLIGVSLFAEGILSLSTVLTAVKIIRNQKPDRIDQEFFDDKYEDR